MCDTNGLDSKGLNGSTDVARQIVILRDKLEAVASKNALASQNNNLSGSNGSNNASGSQESDKRDHSNRDSSNFNRIGSAVAGSRSGSGASE